MTSPAAGPHIDEAAPDGNDPARGWPDRLAARMDDRLTALGLSTAFRRDCALALLVSLVTGVLLAVLFTDPAVARAQGLDPSHVAVVVVLLPAQALLLCLRRVSPVLCLWTVALLQVVLLAAVPGGGTIRGVAPFVAAYTCGALLPVRRATR
ncbi:MAG: sensor histidine kinase, partial [Pseudonocardia sp.]|nr:sensor histidine kinase [Pseudonocardia sp.]